jgi:hypothetical protein
MVNNITRVALVDFKRVENKAWIANGLAHLAFPEMLAWGKGA